MARGRHNVEMTERPSDPCGAAAPAAPGPGVPAFHELATPAPWRAIEFISDLHLGEDTPDTWAAFQRHLLATDADAVLLLGDIFEAWVGDDSADAGFELQCAGVLQAASQRLWCGFMAGNRDFLVGPGFLRRCGLAALPDPTVLSAFGTRVLLTHGDALCLADTGYQRFRAQVRSPQWRHDFLAQPIETRRAQARRMRDASREHQRGMAPGDYADVDPAAALQWLRHAGAQVMVHGHTHRPASQAIQAPGEAAGPVFLRHVLSDWDLEDPQRPRAEVLRLTAQGFERRPVVPAPTPAPAPAERP
jgi:UDP-2,3-diacylglucosamine hydrolase